MCCSARTATIVFTILGIINGAYMLITVGSSYYKSLTAISGIFTLGLGIFGCYAVFKNKYTWVRIYAYVYIVNLLLSCLQIILVFVFQSDIKDAFALICQQTELANEMEKIVKQCLEVAQVAYNFVIIALFVNCAFSLWIILAALSAARTMESSPNINSKV